MSCGGVNPQARRADLWVYASLQELDIKAKL
jgi:hypothetical protein